MSKRKVENTSYIKDTSTGVVVNANDLEYRNARSRRSKQQKEQLKIKNLEHELTDMKSMMSKLLAEVRTLKNGR